MRTFFFSLLGTIAAILVLVFFLFAIASLAVGDEPDIPENGVLYINIQGSLPDFVAESELQEALEGSSTSVFGVFEALQKAAVDARIKAVIFKGGGTSMAFASHNEMAAAIDSFRQTSGKPVYFYADYFLNGDAFFASLCDSTFILPEAVVALKGLAISGQNVAAGLSKLGIKADFISVGEYKDYPETFTREKMSESTREVYNSIIDYAWRSFTQQLAVQANKTVAEVLADIEGGVFSPQQALALGYVDSLLYRDQLLDRFGEDSELVSFASYAMVSRKSLGLFSGKTIALIFANGSMTTGSSGNDPLLGETLGAASLSRDIRLAAESEQVKAIVLRINSPGGLANAAEILWREIDIARQQKPVVVSIGPVCASGGYYLAMAADTIISHPGSLVGSIGVFAGKFITRELFREKLGINSEAIERGPYASLYSSDRGFSERERELLQADMEKFYQRFVTKVANARRLSYDEIAGVAEGRVWIGEDNLNTGLVDAFGNLSTAMRVAMTQAGYDSTQAFRYRVYPRPRDLVSELRGRTNILMTPPLDLVKEKIARWNNRLAVFAMWPERIRID
jgi:protease-4